MGVHGGTCDSARIFTSATSGASASHGGPHGPHSPNVIRRIDQALPDQLQDFLLLPPRHELAQRRPDRWRA
jgi:hypothetical protein